MASAGAQNKRKPRENQYLFDLGVRGRKTGLTVADTGIRDENGLEPMDHLFSSPEKSTRSSRTYARNAVANASLSSDEMEIGESTVPEPTAVINERASMRMPPPRAKSPIKTYLQSPARRNPLSSPARASIMASRTSVTSSVRRKLDFSADNPEDNVLETSASRSSSLKKATTNGLTSSKLGSGIKLSAKPQRYSLGESEGEEAEEDHASIGEDEDESIQMVDIGGNSEAEEEVEEEDSVEQSADQESEPEPLPTKKTKSKQKQLEVEAEAPAPKKRGRKRKDAGGAIEPASKRSRRSLDESLPEPEVEPESEAEPTPEPAAKPRTVGRPSKAKLTAAAKQPKAKTAGKTLKLAPIREAASPEVSRGPPLPRNSRGLLILRRETTGGDSFTQTRSGRNSHKPLAYWKNERPVYSDDEEADIVTGKKFLMPRLKGVVRADEVEREKKTRSYYRPSKNGKMKKTKEPESEDEDETEPWEVEPGRIVGDIKSYSLLDPTGAETEEREDEIALSAAAIVTRDVGAGATFKFAKTLTLPFFGSGMVDLPPGGVKKPKNSRRMQMVFFVFYGRVEVTVNGNKFRIGKGGMWQVPRGNFYSITNDYDKPARIFFSQGNEVEVEVVEEE